MVSTIRLLCRADTPLTLWLASTESDAMRTRRCPRSSISETRRNKSLSLGKRSCTSARKRALRS
ncbi:hypothetical protein Y695_03754 [Hydrogenophaga sp. T4]|nr:hypothetical protein Y695_03754 [Hydrogenophaga sp. T4]